MTVVFLCSLLNPVHMYGVSHGGRNPSGKQGGFLVSPAGGLRPQAWECPGAAFTNTTKGPLGATDIYASFWGQRCQVSRP